ncbi:hypothetical protein WJX74_002371 [Apatococcus lobatus]|uniref:FAD/NAD(P)-binding domain-containing protein n=1 Tax=Apatococcus lobatus TaxID=904363 RepID=A0AAW1QGU7_9CHLO
MEAGMSPAAVNLESSKLHEKVAGAMGRAEIAKQVAQFGAKVPELASLQAGHFRNLVVGGGPAGYAVVSTLLDGGSSPTLWVDPAFQSGRLAQYLEVPSNTKTKLFAKFATTPACGSDGAALDPYQGEDPEKGCPLQAAQQMVVRLSENMHQNHSDMVTMRRGFVDSLDWMRDSWRIDDGRLTADCTFLATGASPQEPDGFPGLPYIPLDDALIPPRLPGHVSSEDTVCVIGSSHSAILVLKNLLDMKSGPKVINLYRSDLKYAREAPGGAIILDNTGLKGLAADWAREKLATGCYEKQGKLQRINTTKEDASEAIKDCTKLVSATGFKRNRLPELSVDGIPMRDVQHDKHTGAIIPGRLYGYGIAFPEEIVDPAYGHKESNVGLWKFMRYAREVLPAQQLCGAPA